ncbi:MAG: phospholipid carrier-dependent glycosyltransferase [Bryobacteraceae bacterium]
MKRPADRWFLPAAIAIVTAMAGVLTYTASLENQTYDEGVHIVAGMSYWSTGDFRLNVEHPPLAKLLFALPPMASGLRFDAASPHWAQPDQTALGSDFLYRSSVGADTILALSRGVTIGLTAMLGLGIAYWTRHRFGPGAGLFALCIYALDPTFLAHGRYATTDVPVTFFSFLSVAAWVEWLDTGGKKWLFGAAVLFGLAAATKFSALYVIPVHAGLGVAAWVGRRRTTGETMAAAAAVAASGILICSAAYGWEGLQGRGPENFPPGHPYMTGLRTLAQHNQEGHAAYLLGSIGSSGRWDYFPTAFAIKSPVGTLLLLAPALAAFGRIARRDGWLVPAALLAYPTTYFALSMASNINIGVRHLLPAYPFLIVLTGAWWSLRGLRWRIAGAGLLASIAVEDIRVFPDYLAFFNAAAGGKDAGPRYLLDSNIDWGQDVKKLGVFLKRHGIESIPAALFTNADPAYYGVHTVAMPVEPEGIAAMKGWAAISVTELHGVYHNPPRYGRFKSLSPVARVGGSIYVYDIAGE